MSRRPPSRTPLWVSAGLLVVLAALPLVVRDSYYRHTIILALIYLMIVAAWDLITGYAGIFSFGQIAFFVVGAYASGILSKSVGISPWLTMPIAAVLTALVGLAIGLPCLRIRGVYVAVVTYALHLVLPTFILRGEAVGTGGTGGLLAIPALSVPGYAFNALEKLPWYYVALSLAAMTVYVVYFRLVHSDFGLAFTALRDAEGFAKSLGIDEYRTKLWVFATSAFFTGLAGAFYAHYTGSLSQKLLGMDFFLLLMIMLTVGGMGRYPGALLGTFVFSFVNAVVNEFPQVSGSARLIVMGAVIILTILVMPRGLVQLLDLVGRRVRRHPRSAPTTPA